jgi:dihydrolipoamide dehydrogenase
MAEEFDVIVIGSGPGGYVCAIRCAQLGLKTANVEYEEALGGTCGNVGCIPSKALLQSSEYYAMAAHDFEKHGIKVGKLALDLDAMLKRKDEVVKQGANGVAALFKKNKVARLKGRGSFVDAHTIRVTAVDGSKVDYKTKHTVIATGSKPIEIPPAKYDRNLIVSSTGALKFEGVPKHLLIVGGGVIGVELGSVWLRLGAQVTVIEALDHILGSMDLELGKGLKKILEKEGMVFHLSTKLMETKTGKAGVTAICQQADGSPLELKGDRMLVAVGRGAYTEGLGLDAIGIKTERGKVPVDEHWRTPVPDVWAIGDAIRGPMLAHKAEDEGVAVAELIAGRAGHVNYQAIPGVVYTWPEVAAVGMTEEEAKAAGLAVKIGKVPFLVNGRARALGNTDGFVKIIADAKTDRIVGAHILGPNASELIAELAVAIEFSATAEDLARSTHAHPTLAECIKEAALGVDKRTINL